MTLDNIFFMRETLEKIFPDWQVTDELEIIQNQSSSVKIITHQQMGQVKKLGLITSGFIINPKSIWIQFSIIHGGAGIG